MKCIVPLAPRKLVNVLTIEDLVSGGNSESMAKIQDIAGLKLLSSNEDKSIALVEDMGFLYRYDAQSMLVSDDNMVVRPTEISSDSNPGRWIKIVGASIDDSNPISTTTTYSSAKINEGAAQLFNEFFVNPINAREVWVAPAELGGSNTTGNGTKAKPFLTAQAAFSTYNPLGHPSDGPEFDRFYIINLMSGVDAGVLECDTTNLIIRGNGELELIYDLKSETMSSWTNPSNEYGLNTIIVDGSGYGNNTSSNHSPLSVKMTLSNYNTSTLEMMVCVNDAKCQIRTQSRDVSGSWAGPIYAQIMNSAIDWLETGTGVAPRNGAMGITFSKLSNVFIRNGIKANNGSVVLPWISDVYCRRAIEGNIGIGIGTGIFRSWNNFIVNPSYGYSITGSSTENIIIDDITYNNMLQCNTNSKLNIGTMTLSLANNPSGATANRPVNGLVIGANYFDTDLGKPIFWNGTAWVDSTGTSV